MPEAEYYETSSSHSAPLECISGSRRDEFSSIVETFDISGDDCGSIDGAKAFSIHDEFEALSSSFAAKEEVWVPNGLCIRNTFVDIEEAVTPRPKISRSCSTPPKVRFGHGLSDEFETPSSVSYQQMETIIFAQNSGLDLACQLEIPDEALCPKQNESYAFGLTSQFETPSAESTQSAEAPHCLAHDVETPHCLAHDARVLFA